MYINAQFYAMANMIFSIDKYNFTVGSYLNVFKII